MNHKYSTYCLLIIIGVILAVASMALLESEDIDEVCNQTGAIMKRTTTGWECSITHYGEMYYHNTTVALNIPISQVNVYYPLKGMNISNTQGVNNTNNENFTITKNSTYEIQHFQSFKGGNFGTYETELFINEIGQPDCITHRATSSTATGVAGFTCIKTLKKGDVVNIKVEDQQAPAQNVNFDSINFNIIEVQ